MQSNKLNEKYKRRVAKLDIEEIERCLAYTFKAKARLIRALTHHSLSDDHNDVMEFRGDKILGFLMSEIIERQVPGLDVAERQEIFESLTNNRFLSEKIARDWRMPEFMLTDDVCSRNTAKSISDAVEAVICAVYDDADMEGCAHFLVRHWKPYIQQVIEEGECREKLSRYFNEFGLGEPKYKVSKNGRSCTLVIPSHDFFDSAMTIKAEGKTKRRAKNNAATKALNALDIDMSSPSRSPAA